MILGLLLLLLFSVATAGWGYAGGPKGSTAQAAANPILDIGIAHEIVAFPTENKLTVKIRPTVTVTNGAYSEGIFTIKCPVGVALSILSSPYGYVETYHAVNDGGFDYYIYYTSPGSPYTVNWTAGTEYELLTLTYACAASASFQIVPTYTKTYPNPGYTPICGCPMTITQTGNYYQELNALESQNVIYQSTVSSAYSVTNTNTGEQFCTIQAAINDAQTLDGHTLVVAAGSRTEGTVTVTKSLTIKGANFGINGNDPTDITLPNGARVAESVLVGTTFQVSDLNVTIDGFRFTGASGVHTNGVAANAANGLSITNNVFSDITTAAYSNNSGAAAQSNITFSNNRVDGNYSAGIAALNPWDGSSNVTISSNYFTEFERGVQFDNASASTVSGNHFKAISFQGIQVGPNSSGISILSNTFDNCNTGAEPDRGAIRLYANVTGSIVIEKNIFKNNYNAVRIRASASYAHTFFNIRYNIFEASNTNAISDGSTAGTGKTNGLCNWYGDVTGPTVAANPGGAGEILVDPNAQVNFRNWLMYGNDQNALLPGFQIPTAVAVAPGANVSAAENHYRILSNAVGCALAGQTFTLAGTFDWTNATAQADWANGNDGNAAASDDNYSILAPANVNTVTLTAASLGSAVIQGPGDLPLANLEGVFVFDGGDNQNWIIENLEIKDFDLSIAFFNGAGGTDAFNNLKIRNNKIWIPKDLNTTVAPADPNQNIGLHFSFGANEEISGNTFEVDGTGVSDAPANYSSTVVMQSNTSGGTVYDGLQIINNTIHVSGAQNANPATIFGIWENGHNQDAAIDISGNTFTNLGPGNNPALNLQRAFRVTSKSGALKQVTYLNNQVDGANNGIQWFSGYTYPGGAMPVLVQNNKFDNTYDGIVVQTDGSSATVFNNSFTNTVRYAINNAAGTGTTAATCNWYGTAVANLIAPMIAGNVTYSPYLINGTDDSPGTIGFQTSAPCTGAPVSISIATITDETCSGGATNGAVTTTTTAGTAPFSYLWSNGAVTANISGVVGGIYTVTVTDANLSTASASATVNSYLVTNLTTNANFATIQAAINAALPGETIQVCAGTFTEHVVIDKSLTLQGVTEATCIVNGSGLPGTGKGIQINNGITNVTIKRLTIQNFAGSSGNADAGVYAIGGNDGLSADHLTIKNNVGGSGFYANGPVTNVTLDYITSFGHTIGARGIVIWNGLKSNISITNCHVYGNNCCGIELQDGSATGVTLSNNNVHDNGDSGMAAIGLTGPGANVISTNTVTDNGRFGIEIKDPNGNTTLSGNIVSRTLPGSGVGSFLKDYAGIAVFRRGVSIPNGNVDVPNNVSVTGNSVSGYRKNPLSTESEGFGIVIEGVSHTVTGNTLTNNDVGLQLQGGGHPNANYPAGDGNDADGSSASYFGRGNAPYICDVLESGNIFSANTLDRRMSTAVGVVFADPGGLSTINNQLAKEVTLDNTVTQVVYCSIQSAINAATGSGVETVKVASGATPTTYNEQVLVNKDVTILGIGATKPVVDFTGTVSGKPTLLDISKAGVNVENLNLRVDLTKLSSAIIASALDLDNLVVKDNMIGAYGSSAAGSFGSYGDRNAISINYGGSTNYRIAAGGVDNLLVQNNMISGVPNDGFGVPRYFRSGVSLDEGGGTFIGNTIQTINHDLLVRFGGNGNITMTGNFLNGGGIELSEMNAGAGTLTIAGNTFDATFANVSAPGTAVLRLKNNQTFRPTLVNGGNVFLNHEWAVSLENYNTVTLDGNTFTPLANSTTYHHVTVNTKSISTNSNAIVQTTLDATLTNNTFNGSGTPGGTALSFHNHDSDAAAFGTFTIGTAGNENNFNDGIGNFVYLDNQTGASSGASFPNYTAQIGAGPAAVTTMACWAPDINIQHNKFDVGTGLKLPSALNFAERSTLETRLFHKPDFSCLGRLIHFYPVTNLNSLKQFITIQEAINDAQTLGGHTLELAEWTFNERVTLNKSLTIQGGSSDKTTHVLTGTGLAGTGSGIQIANGVTGVTIKNLTVQNFTGANGNSDAGIYAIGGNDNLTVTNVALLNNTNASGFYANGPINTVSVTNSMVTNSGPGARGIVIWNGFKQNITISNNMVTNNVCCGIELQDGTASNVNVIGNTIDIGSGDNAIGLLGLTNSVGANLIQGNIITGGGRFGIEIKNPNGGVTVNNNSVTLTTLNADQRDRAGIAVYRRDFTSGNPSGYADIPNGVSITNNTVTGYTQASSDEGFGIVVEGVSHSVTGNTLTNNEVGLQLQGGGHANPNYVPNDAGNGDQTVGNSPNYFGRGNTPYLCDVAESGNTFVGNTIDRRLAIASGVFTDLPTINNQLAKEVTLDNTVTQVVYCSIQSAINAATGSGVETVKVASGAAQTTYNEQVLVNKDVTILGIGATKPIVDFTGTVSGKPALFDISADGVVVDRIQFEVDLSKLSSAIIASAVGLDNIVLQNNMVNPRKSIPLTYFGAYSDRNAFSINYGGSTNYRVASGGVNSILVDNNMVTATVNGALLGDDSGDIGFRAAVAVDEGAGTYTRNTFQTINHDILIRFNSNGPVLIGGSAPNANTFNGGGVTIADPNAAGGAVTISNNAFNGLVTGSVLRLENNYYNAVTTVSNNTFSNLRWGISLENYPAATVSNNVFTPLAGYTAFRHITVNTKSLSGNSATILQVPINGVFTGNTFNSLTPVAGGIAMAFYNHDSDNDNLGAFTLGTAGSPNTFAKDFSYAVYLGDQTGPTYPAPLAFPEYDLGGGSNTTMACWDKDIDIQNNTFNVGAGAQLPVAMNHAQRLALEGILYHLPDNACLGELTYFLPVTVYAQVFLQGPYDPATNLMNDDLRSLSGFPLSEPFSQYNTPAYHFAFTHVNNNVVETISPTVLTTTGQNAIVDWVFLELRNKLDNTQVLATRSALLQRDGDIVDLDGTSPVLFGDSYQDQYYLMVRHRNHLGALTLATVDYTAPSPTVINFSDPALSTFGTTTTSARALLEPGVYGLWAGNTNLKANNLNFQIKYNGTDNDRTPILNVVGPSTPLNVVSGYYLEDVNLNGQVKYSGSGNDRVVILNNVGVATPLNVITQEPGN